MHNLLCTHGHATKFSKVHKLCTHAKFSCFLLLNKLQALDPSMESSQLAASNASIATHTCACRNSFKGGGKRVPPGQRDHRHWMRCCMPKLMQSLHGLVIWGSWEFQTRWSSGHQTPRSWPGIIRRSSVDSCSANECTWIFRVWWDFFQVADRFEKVENAKIRILVQISLLEAAVSYHRRYRYCPHWNLPYKIFHFSNVTIQNHRNTNFVIFWWPK